MDDCSLCILGTSVNNLRCVHKLFHSLQLQRSLSSSPNCEEHYNYLNNSETMQNVFPYGYQPTNIQQPQQRPPINPLPKPVQPVQQHTSPSSHSTGNISAHGDRRPNNPPQRHPKPFVNQNKPYPCQPFHFNTIGEMDKHGNLKFGQTPHPKSPSPHEWSKERLNMYGKQ